MKPPSNHEPVEARGWRLDKLTQMVTDFQFELPPGGPPRLKLVVLERQVRPRSYDLRFTPEQADALIAMLKRVRNAK